MTPAQIPPDDAQRLAALRDLLILDTPPEVRFDRITDFAAKEFGVPMAVISLVDKDRQWFKARTGLSACETSRDVSFCGHTILQDDLFIVEDAHANPDFADNPLVTGDPFIRFYAGAPLRLPTGESLGSLCLLDRVPGQLDAMGRGILCSLRDLAVEELLARRTAA